MQGLGLEEHQRFVEVSTTTVLSYKNAFNFYCDKDTANPAVAHDPHAYLKEVLNFS